MEQFDVMTRGAALVLFAALGASLGAPSLAAGQHPSATAYFEFIRGRHLESMGQIAQALEAYRLAAEADPKSAAIPAEIATLNARANRTEEARRAAGQALAIDPENAEAHWVLGTILAAELEGRAEAGRPASAAKPSIDEAIAHLERARPSRSLDIGLALTLGRLYLSKRDFPKALELIEPVREREPEHAEAAYLMAQAQLGAGDLERRRSLDAVIRQEPQFTRALIDRADVALRLRRFDDAAAAFGKAAAAMPDRLDLKLRQASALLRAGALDAARDLLETVERDRGDDSRVPFLLVEVERARRYASRRAARRVIEPSPIASPATTPGPGAGRSPRAPRRNRRTGPGHHPPRRQEDARWPLRASIGVAYLQLREFDAGIAAIDRARRDGGPIGPRRCASGQARGGRRATRRSPSRRGPARRSGQPAPARLEAETAAARRAPLLTLPASIDTDGGDVDTHIVRRPAAQTQGSSGPRRCSAPRARAFRRDVDPLPARRRLRAGLRRPRRLPRCAADRSEARADPQLSRLHAGRARRKLDEAVKLLHEAVDLDPYNGSYLDSLGGPTSSAAPTIAPGPTVTGG
jgi:tetratricopeptide (TPR) repeat protein